MINKPNPKLLSINKFRIALQLVSFKVVLETILKNTTPAYFLFIDKIIEITETEQSVSGRFEPMNLGLKGTTQATQLCRSLTL